MSEIRGRCRHEIPTENNTSSKQCTCQTFFPDPTAQLRCLCGHYINFHEAISINADSGSKLSSHLTPGFLYKAIPKSSLQSYLSQASQAKASVPTKQSHNLTSALPKRPFPAPTEIVSTGKVPASQPTPTQKLPLHSQNQAPKLRHNVGLQVDFSRPPCVAAVSAREPISSQTRKLQLSVLLLIRLADDGNDFAKVFKDIERRGVMRTIGINGTEDSGLLRFKICWAFYDIVPQLERIRFGFVKIKTGRTAQIIKESPPETWKISDVLNVYLRTRTCSAVIVPLGPISIPLPQTPLENIDWAFFFPRPQVVSTSTSTSPNNVAETSQTREPSPVSSHPEKRIKLMHPEVRTAESQFENLEEPKLRDVSKESDAANISREVLEPIETNDSHEMESPPLPDLREPSVTVEHNIGTTPVSEPIVHDGNRYHDTKPGEKVEKDTTPEKETSKSVSRRSSELSNSTLTTRSLRALKESDYVLVKLENLIPDPIRLGRSKKSLPKHIGPYKIAQKISNTLFKLNFPSIFQINHPISTQHLLLYENEPDSYKSFASYSEAESILDKQMGTYEPKYLVKWKFLHPEAATWRNESEIRDRKRIKFFERVLDYLNPDRRTTLVPAIAEAKPDIQPKTKSRRSRIISFTVENGRKEDGGYRPVPTTSPFVEVMQNPKSKPKTNDPETPIDNGHPLSRYFNVSPEHQNLRLDTGSTRSFSTTSSPISSRHSPIVLRDEDL